MKAKFDSTKIRPLTVALIAVAAPILAQSANAQSVGQSCIYVRDSASSIARDGLKDCVHTSNWRKDLDVVECGGTPPPVPKADPKPEPKPTPPPPVVIQTQTFGATAWFDFDKSVLRPAGKKELDDLVDKIKGLDLVSIKVVGHTCDIGTEKYNQGLSERRAKSVKDYLVSKGIPESKIDTTGMGETSPAVPNTGKANREKNRRSEIEVKANKKQ